MLSNKSNLLQTVTVAPVSGVQAAGILDLALVFLCFAVLGRMLHSSKTTSFSAIFRSSSASLAALLLEMSAFSSAK